uniref:Uncharacterized protein n=1 Tax=Anguilla anguilla TaxID=7936 RepID=A0A0E9W717_ANGAN
MCPDLRSLLDKPRKYKD